MPNVLRPIPGDPNVDGVNVLVPGQELRGPSI